MPSCNDIFDCWIDNGYPPKRASSYAFDFDHLFSRQVMPYSFQRVGGIRLTAQVNKTASVV